MIDAAGATNGEGKLRPPIRTGSHSGRNFAALVVLLVLAGCHGVRLHDAPRAASAAGARKALASVDTAAVVKVEQDNLDRLLAEELKSLQTRARIDSDLALLEIADNDQSVARHYLRLKEVVVERFGAVEFDVLAARRSAQVQQDADRATQARLRNALTRLQVAAPACADTMPAFAALAGASALDAVRGKLAASTYASLVETCARLAKTAPDPVAGELESTRRQAQAARADLARLNRDAAAAQKALAGARAEYAQAVAQVQKAPQAGPEAKAAIEARATAILDHLRALEAASPTLAGHAKAGALAEVLAAVAGGPVDPTDKELAPALVIAKAIPSLAGTIAGIEARRTAPTVSNLVLALNHQTLAVELDARLASIAEEEVQLLEEKMRALEGEVALWRSFNDQLCNLALLASGAPHPSTSCGPIAFDPVPGPGTASVACRLTLLTSDKPRESTIPNCILGRPWKALLADRSLGSATQRALYEAVIAYLNARIAGNRAYEYDFKLVHRKHRISLALRESALRQWNNVVSVPVEQLDAYYASGIKPAELADLLVKALGFTAIAIGVAQ